MSVIDRFKDYLSNKIKFSGVSSVIKEITPDIFEDKGKQDSVKISTDLIENLNVKEKGIYNTDNAFLIMERIVKDKNSDNKDYAVKKIESILNNNSDSFDYYLKTKELFSVFKNITEKNEKIIISFLNYLKQNTNPNNKILHLNVLGKLFEFGQPDFINNDVRESLEDILSNIIISDLKVFNLYQKKHESDLSRLVLSYNKEDYKSYKIFTNKILNGLSKEDKIKYIGDSITKWMKNDYNTLWNDQLIFKENIPTYIEHVKSLDYKDVPYSLRFLQFAHKEIAEVVTSGNFAAKIKLDDVLHSIKYNFERIHFVGVEEFLVNVKDSVSFIRSQFPQEEREKLKKFFDIDDGLSKLILNDPTNKIAIGYMEFASELTKDVDLNQWAIYEFEKDFLPLLQKNDPVELEHFISKVMNNEMINNIFKSKIIENANVPKEGYFNIKLNNLENLIQCYAICSKVPEYNKKQFFDNLFDMESLKQGYLIHDFKKAEMMLELAKTQDASIQKEIIFGMIKFNSMYKRSDEDDISVIEEYEKIKSYMKEKIKENNLSFKISELVLSENFNQGNLTLDNIIDMNEFEFGIKDISGLNKLKTDEEYIKLFKDSPLNAYVYAITFAEKEMLSSLVEEISTEKQEEVITKRKRM